ncbi:hypothetical protein BZA05DRAFT_382039 [Tricharina praecox]|uniref:uncharacterized protein n=1 Tax=Tricharina praecox TaxID=43433 RepID=UPI00221E3DEC|nr:uncharacterized protein BZA05DRAFT_382039 [Tricharina praecox]KAI5858653.1 hypothetical protein BZA05DRAFT_382039 [Tricharina praecox]
MSSNFKMSTIIQQRPVEDPPREPVYIPTSHTSEVPNYPFVSGDDEIKKFLETQFLTSALDELSPWLWLVATPKSSHISSLHEQLVREREIVITEKASLHLLWHGNRVFIKPLPSYLFDETFQQQYVVKGSAVEKAIRGYLRSYTYLLQSPSDLEVAIELKLLPRRLIEQLEKSKAQGAPWRDFFSILREFHEIPDDTVSRRYRYGDLRLGRVNFWNRVFRFEMYYHKPYGQYGTYFGQFVEPFVFVFGTASVVLSAMQVVLAAIDGSQSPDWNIFFHVSKWFSVGSVVFVAATISLIAATFVLLILREAVFALRGVFRRKRKSQ